MAVTELQFPFPGHAETVTIASGASLSAEINCRGRVPKRIIMPAAWTAANLTFQTGLVTGGSFTDKYDPAGTEYLVVAAAGREIPLPYDAFAAIPFLKIRSGTAAAAVLQAADRTLTVVFWEPRL